MRVGSLRVLRIGRAARSGPRYVELFWPFTTVHRSHTDFLLPRWRPDGLKNAMQIQRLKDKLGNVSNASSETELRGALAWMVGEEGRGVATIIERATPFV